MHAHLDHGLIVTLWRPMYLRLPSTLSIKPSLKEAKLVPNACNQTLGEVQNICY